MSADYARNWQQLNPKQSPKKEQQHAVKKSRKTGWITKGEKVIYSFTFAAMIVAGIFIVSYSSLNDSLNRELQSLEENVKTQVVVNEGLIFEKKELSRPERIIEIAKQNGLKIQQAEVKQAQTFNN
ncbi:cell division protein FtsL [Oceanobacillus piezotolerans]|uniref:Cell division protein FtsL n=1 Tax=Oceanobacillus piezotolerans TaxID=2448030 RepID=A0A498D9D1_9BACI|nr:cell division protein FtsL [Oceanobacillus piezotolerans]RLL45231.1 cell division protein FtsL [Oceanobacillus piezotolerans]